MMDNMPRPVDAARVTRRDKRRNRRRKSKYSRPLVSFAHLLVLVKVGLIALFAVALWQGLDRPPDLTLRSAQGVSDIDAALPGAAAPAVPRRGAGLLQYALWAYLFGTPLLFAVLRGAFWRRVANGGRLVVFTTMGVWCMVIMVILVTPNIN
ncbi:MAG: hypothetical protein AAF676_02240 [Pseudomonadota bacterium]